MASVDAQRLIALSIGKLQASRSQRGGIDLHKNLLVSHVLYTARTALLTGMVPEYYRAETTAVESDIEDETVDCPETAEEVAVPVAESTECDSALPSGEGEETKNLCTLTPVVDLAQPPLTSASGNVDSRLQEADVTLADSVDKENLSTEQQQNITTTSLQPAVLGERCANVPTASCDDKRSAAPCSCCRKRKQSETEAACDSISPKKRRIEKQETDSETDSWETEDMCTDSPVSSLVNIFNSGFKGLVHSSIELESEPPQQAVARSGPNSSKQGLQQCMQEVVTSIGTLARPIVAF